MVDRASFELATAIPRCVTAYTTGPPRRTAFHVGRQPPDPKSHIARSLGVNKLGQSFGV